MSSLLTSLRKSIDKHLFSIVVLFLILLSGALLTIGSRYFENAITAEVNTQTGEFYKEKFPASLTDNAEDIEDRANQ